MADGIETSHETTVATPIAAHAPETSVPTVSVTPEIQAQSPADLPAAIAAMIAGQEANAAKIAKAETPSVESPALQPAIEPAGPEVWITGPSAEAADVGPYVAPPADAKPEPKMPTVAHLAEVVAPATAASNVSAPEVAPPTFLREHATRTIAAAPPLRTGARSGGKAPPPVKLPVKAAPPPRESTRRTKFILLAASVAICAGAGAALGSVGLASIMHAPASASTQPPAAVSAEVKALRETVTQLGADLAATRAALEHIGKTNGTQFGKIADRFDRAEKAQSDPAAKLTKISDALDRLEKRVASLPIPVAAVAPAPAANPPPIQSEVVGSITPRPAAEPKAPPKQPPVLDSFVLRRVYDGVALIEGRNGVMEVEPGQSLPGGGRVEDIKRQDGHWVVVTSKGLIVSQRDR